MLSLKELHLRAALFQSIRKFFHARDFLEVDTPSRLPVIIPERHIQPISADGLYLQTSPELCMKRLLAAGCTQIFQICNCFRKEEQGRHHLEEFVMLEWYRTDGDYFGLMRDCEELLRYLAKSNLFAAYPGEQRGQKGAREQIQQIFRNSSLRISVADAFAKWSPISLSQALADDSFDQMLVEYIEPQLGIQQPTFLYDYPAPLGALARKKKNNPEFAERFELYIDGIELANGFSELTDPVEQQARFLEELDSIQAQHRIKQKMPDKFLNDLDKFDEAAGIALGFDRLFMLILGKDTLHDVVTFAPQDM